MPIDMFIEVGDDPRREPPAQGDERETLLAFLQWYRDTLDLKCSGLDADQLALRPFPSSSMSLLGMIRHMADVERGWFRRTMAGDDAEPHFWSSENRDGDWEDVVADEGAVSEAWDRWREEMAYADRLIAAADDLDSLAKKSRHDFHPSLRWVVVHMIEEYARHCGHADLMREQIDGRVGQ